MAQVFSPQVADCLEPALQKAILGCNWRLRFEIMNAARACFIEWLSAVRARISRTFLPQLGHGLEGRLLREVRTILDNTKAWVEEGRGSSAPRGPPLPLQ
eukprot:814650-Prymnesium_polylepis.1